MSQRKNLKAGLILIQAPSMAMPLRQNFYIKIPKHLKLFQKILKAELTGNPARRCQFSIFSSAISKSILNLIWWFDPVKLESKCKNVKYKDTMLYGLA